MASIDWEKILRMGNSYYDRMVAVGRQPTRSQRQEALAQFTEDLEEERVAFLKRTYSPLAGKSLRNVLSVVMEGIFVSPLRSSNSIDLTAEDRGMLHRDMEQVALAMAAYRADHGSYPDRLETLAPKYIKKIPIDVFSDGPLHYQRQGKGYLLYSVGVDGEDNGGHTFDSEEPGDDLVIRVPRKETAAR